MANSQIKELSHAIQKQNMLSLKDLVSKFDNSNPYKPEVDRVFTSPLHCLIFHCTVLSRESKKSHKCVEMVQILLPKLQKVNEHCDLGRTIFHWIVLDEKDTKSPCFIQILKILVPKSNLNLKDYLRKTALQYAENFVFSEIVKLFKPWYDDNLDLPPMDIKKDSRVWNLINLRESRSSSDEYSNDDEDSSEDSNEDSDQDSDEGYDEVYNEVSAEESTEESNEESNEDSNDGFNEDAHENTKGMNEKFLKAIKKGDLTKVKKFSNQGSPNDLLKLDFKEGDKDTPLHYACKHGHLEIVKFILAKGASTNIDMISSAMYYATMLFDQQYVMFQILGELLKHGAIIDFELENGTCILDYSRVNESKDVLKFLLENGSFDPEIKKTRLHWAARFGLPDLVKKFLKKGDDPNPKNFLGETPYDVAKDFYESALFRKSAFQKVNSH